MSQERRRQSAIGKHINLPKHSDSQLSALQVYERSTSNMRQTLIMLPLVLAGLVLAQPRQKALTHFGNCQTLVYGAGRCLHRGDCNFSALDSLDAGSKQQCQSQQRPDLVCCPRQDNILPMAAARQANSSRSSSSSSSSSSGANAVDELPSYPHCGTSFAFKVVGGANTHILEFPWTTLLEYTLNTGKKERLCGAVFIAQRWLLTAAHCVHIDFLGADVQLTNARLGEWNQTSNPDCITLINGQQECVPPYIDARIDRILAHPRFNPKTYEHDICLLRLAEPVNWQSLQHVEPVCLPLTTDERNTVQAGRAVDVSGWGRTSSNELSDIKRKAVLHVMGQRECQTIFAAINHTISDQQLCATGGKGVDSCFGDSGGPLTFDALTSDSNSYVSLAGIVSFGLKKCGDADFPGVYTRVSDYMDWIQQTMRQNTAPSSK